MRYTIHDRFGETNLSPKRTPLDEPLPLQQEAFVQAYTTPDSETYHNALKSCLAAGYSQASSKTYGCALLRKGRVRRRIDQIELESARQRVLQTAVTIAYVREEHARLAAECEKRGDYANATRNLELLGKTIGAYSDVLVLDASVLADWDARKELEAARLARLLLAHADLPVIEGEAGPAPVAIEARPHPERASQVLALLDTPETGPEQGANRDETPAPETSDPPSPPTGPGVESDVSTPPSIQNPTHGADDILPVDVVQADA